MNNNFEGEDFYGPPKLVWLGLISGLMVFFLYLISPNDVSESLPSPYASRYLWSPLIPILITISITTLCLASFLDMLYGKFLVISVNFIFFLILLSPQFAEWTPIESDGWWFVQISERYSEYGNDGTELYLSRMITVIPLDMVSKIFPNHLPFFSSIFGLIISSMWISMTFDSISHHTMAKRLSVPVFLIIALLMISWWSPLQYTAQMLSLLFYVYVMKKTSHDEKYKFSYFLCLLLIPLTHLQSPMIICSILFVESILRTESSDKAINSLFILGIFFISWNFTIGSESFLILIPDLIKNYFGIMESLMLLFLLVFLLKINLIRNGLRKSKIWGGSDGISNLSIVLGCILILPVMYIGDQKIGAARLVPRLLVYSIVPLTFWLLMLCTFLDGKFRSMNIDKKYFSTFLIIFSLIGGSLAGIAHTNYSARTLMIPSETSKCWEMTEEAGIVGLMRNDDSEARGYIIHSPIMLSNADEDNFWFFVHLGDESRVSHLDFDYYSGILQTADINSNTLKENNLPLNIFETWHLAGEVHGACKFWVNPDDINFLNPDLNWDST